MKPIYDFTQGKFKSFLSDKFEKIINKYDLDTRFELNLDYELPRTDYVEEDNLTGFFTKSKEGFVNRYYQYLKNFYVEDNGFPVAHLMKCQKVKQLTFAKFVYANTNTVDIDCRNTGRLYQNIVLKTCDYCLAEFLQENFNGSFHTFLLDLEENEKTRTKLKLPTGYSINWKEISTAYRIEQDYTCENCKVSIKDEADKYLMQTHHCNYDKMNNKRSNLKCLCVLCHSKVDERHKTNFSTRENKTLVQKFKLEYFPELYECGNPYL